jgi:hypothetical protein
MAGIQDFVEFVEDFLGPQTLTASPTGSDLWDIADTSSAGTPTYTVGGINGEATLAFDTQAEVQNVCLYMSDKLNFDIDKLLRVEMAVKMGQAAVDATTSLAFGLASARHDAIDSIAAHASFRVIGSGSTTAVVVESDDGTTDKDDIATGATLINAYKRFVIDFSGGTSDVKFYIDGVQVATSTTFDMSGYTAGLQPYVQLQKTSDANADSVVIDYIKIVSRR